MSTATMAAVEDAIRAHLADVNEDDDPGVLIDWVLGVTLSKINSDGDVAYRNAAIGPNNNPNAQAHLAMWVSDEIADQLRWTDEED